MSYDDNPFEDICIERAAIWQMLVYRDIDAFLAADWSMTEPDIRSEGFFGVDAAGSSNLDTWQLKFADITSYRDEWLRQATDTQATADMHRARRALFETTDLSKIDLSSDMALAHKKFSGEMPLAGGGSERLNWQTLYVCRKAGGSWKIASFIGYMKYEVS